MRIRHTQSRGFAFFVGAALLVPFSAPADGHAQENLTDSRWLPWVGCWEGAGIEEGDNEAPLLVCFRPTDEGGAVESLTYSSGTLLGSEVLRADGSPTALSEGGCEGTRSMEWSEDRSRVFLSSEMRCGDEVTRATHGVFAFLQNGTGWSEILSAQAAGGVPLLEIRSFVPASPALLIQSGIADPMAGRELAVNTARLRAGAALSPDALAELVAEAGATVTGGLLVERGEGFAPDAAMLRSLSENGVPGEILDLVVALSYPSRFQIAGGAPTSVPEPETSVATRTYPRATAPWGGSLSYSPWGRGRYNGYGVFGYDGYYEPYYYDPFYYDPYYSGSPYRGYRPPRYIIIQPPVVVDPTPTAPPVRVDRDTGYSSGASGRSPSTPTPRTSPPPARSTPPRAEPAPAPAPAPSTGGGNRDSNDNEPRRAIPRP